MPSDTALAILAVGAAIDFGVAVLLREAEDRR